MFSWRFMNWQVYRKERNMPLMLISLGIATILCISVDSKQPDQKSFHISPSQLELSQHYTKWLNEDVADIITTEEAQAFTQLQSDDDREQFIESFWRNRDPKPETDKNEYREEHYQRIANANLQFTFNGVAGWQTDRGAILYNLW